VTTLMENTPTKYDILNLLHKNIVEVTFKKINGESRILTCTLMKDKLPPKKTTSELVVEQTNTKKNFDGVTVWDLESNGWRSFRLNSVTNIRVI